MKKIVLNLGLSIFSISILLAFVEIAFRLLPAPKSDQATEEIGGSEGPNWNDRPKFYYDPEGSIDHRGQIHSEAKPENTFRVAVVGDSYSFAPFMQIDDSFASRLGRMLNQNKSQKKAEVVNYGISGYSTSHEIAAVTRAIKEQADLIILQITLNDAEVKEYRPTGKIIATNRFGAYVELPEESWINYSKFLSFIQSRLHVLNSRQKYIDYFFSLYEDPTPEEIKAAKGKKLENGYELFKKSLAEINSQTQAAKVPIIAAIFPLFGVEVDSTYPFDKLHEKISSTLNDLNIQNLDLKNSFIKIPILRMQVIPGVDFHPNEIAHRISAEEIYTFITNKDLVPEELKIKKTYKVRNQL